MRADAAGIEQSIAKRFLARGLRWYGRPRTNDRPSHGPLIAGRNARFQLRHRAARGSAGMPGFRDKR
jgi:hypothetical protein